MPNLRVSNHAVRRYIERIRPTLEGNFAHARVELEGLVASARLVRERPSWIPPRDSGVEAHRWLVVDGCGIVMPVNRAFVVTTVLGNGGVSPQTRARRNERRRARQDRRRRHGSKGGRPNVWTADDPGR